MCGYCVVLFCGVIMFYYCVLLLCVVIACCYLVLLLCVVIVWCHSVLLLCVVIVCCHCVVLWCGVIVLCYYVVLLCVVIVWRYCVLLFCVVIVCCYFHSVRRRFHFGARTTSTLISANEDCACLALILAQQKCCSRLRSPKAICRVRNRTWPTYLSRSSPRPRRGCSSRHPPWPVQTRTLIVRYESVVSYLFRTTQRRVTHKRNGS